MLAVGAAKFWMDDPVRVERWRLRTTPALAAAAAFACGDLCAYRWHPPAQLAAQTALLALIAAFALWRGGLVAPFAVLAFWVAVGCWSAQIEPPIPQHRELLPYADGLSRAVSGRVLRVRALQPEQSSNSDAPAQPWLAEPGAWEQPHEDAAQSIDIALDHIEQVTPDTATMQPVAGGVRILILGKALPLQCGDQITVPLRMRVPDTYRDPGAFSYSSLLAAQGIHLLSTAKSEHVVLQHHGQPTWRCRFVAMQSWASARLQQFAASHANHALPGLFRLDGDDTAMLAAMLVGDRNALAPSLRAGFERTGTFHLFVVSGLHVALLAGALLWLLRRARLPDGIAIPITLLLTTLYALLTGFGIPVQRSLLMTAAYLLARLVARHATTLQTLGIAAIITLSADPRVLYEASFQMTFLIIFTVAGLVLPLREHLHAPYARALHHFSTVEYDQALPPRLAVFRVYLRMWGAVSADLLGKPFRRLPYDAARATFFLCDALLFGIVTECCMALPMAVFFHRATLWALPANAIAMPLVGVLLGCAVATFLLLLLSPWAALPAAAITSLCLHIVRVLVHLFGHAAGGDLRVPSPTVTGLLIAGAVLAFAAWALREQRRALIVAGTVAIACAPLIALWPVPPALHRGQLEVTALDVGQGDALFVATPDGKTLLVDAGGPTGGMRTSARWDTGEDIVAPYLWSRRVRRLDAVLLTHAHSDHMGGMPAVLRDLRPRELWLAASEPANAPDLLALEQEAITLGISIRRFSADEIFSFGDTSIRVLAPEVDYANPGAPANNDSLVVELAYQQAHVLLEGDAEAPSEQAMLANQRIEPATLLKVGHHGSRTSTTEPFLAAVAPRDAVISDGRHNTFGHPRFEVLEELESAHVRTWRTDRFGAVTFLLGADARISAAPAASNP